MTMIKGIGSATTIIQPVVPYAHAETTSPIMPVTPVTAINDQFDKDPARNWKQFLGEAEKINYTIILEDLGTTNYNWQKAAQTLLSENPDINVLHIPMNECNLKSAELNQLLQIISNDNNHLCLQL